MIRAPVAERAGAGPEVLGGAGSFDGVVDGVDAAVDGPVALFGGFGGDDGAVAEVDEPDGAGQSSEDLLAEEGVDVDAGESGLGVGGGGGAAGFVVGDDEVAVGVEFEAVDDAAEAEPVEVRFEHDLEADGGDGGGVFDVEVALDEGAGLIVEGGEAVGVEAEGEEVGIVGHLGDGPVEVGVGGRAAALVGGTIE